MQAVQESVHAELGAFHTYRVAGCEDGSSNGAQRTGQIGFCSGAQKAGIRGKEGSDSPVPGTSACVFDVPHE